MARIRTRTYARLGRDPICLRRPIRDSSGAESAIARTRRDRSTARSSSLAIGPRADGRRRPLSGIQHGIDGSKPRATIGARASSANFRVFPQAGKVPQMCERSGHRALRGAPARRESPAFSPMARLQPLKQRRPMLRTCRPGQSTPLPVAHAAPRPIAPATRSCRSGTGRPHPRSVLRAAASILESHARA